MVSTRKATAAEAAMSAKAKAAKATPKGTGRLRTKVAEELASARGGETQPLNAGAAGVINKANSKHHHSKRRALPMARSHRQLTLISQ